MKKINCGGFYINENDFNINEEGELSLKPTEASSLNDLSDVDIQEYDIYNTNLLKFNIETEKWENVRPDKAILGHEYTDFPGVLCVSDIGQFHVSSGLTVDLNDEFGQMFSQLVEAAIANGQYQMDDMSSTMFRPIINGALASISNNTNFTFYTFASPVLTPTHYFQLVGANNNFAMWSGVIINGVKFYQITFVFLCPDDGDDTTSASVVVKAEELMTYTEPTQTP